MDEYVIFYTIYNGTIKIVVPERRTNMIEGKFVATIEIDIAVDENTPNLLPFEELKEAVHN